VVETARCAVVTEIFSIRDWEPEVLRCSLISPSIHALWPQAEDEKTGARQVEDFARTREAWAESGKEPYQARAKARVLLSGRTV
jgi:hypothetical protein